MIDSVKEALARASARFVERFYAGDIAGAAEVYTEDARILPPGADMITGKPAIAEFWAGAAEAFGIKSITLETVVVEQQGADSACEIGRFSLSGEEGMLDQGKYVVVWKRDADGEWRWDWDIWNSSQS